MMKVTLAQLKPVVRQVSAATKNGKMASVVKKAVPAAAALVVANNTKKSVNTKIRADYDYCSPTWEVSF